MRALLCVLLASLVSRDGPVEWTVLVDQTGRCLFAVPPDWRVDESIGPGLGLVRSRDGRATAMLTWVRKPLTAVAAELSASPYKPIGFELSPHRLVGSYTGGWPGTHHVAATEDEAGSCVLYIDGPEKRDQALERMIDAIAATADSVR